MLTPGTVRSTSRRPGRTLVLSAIAAALFIGFPAARRAGAEVSADQVRAAILRSVAYLKGRRLASGAWPDYAQPGGVTALVAYALLQAGVSPDDEAVAGGLEALESVPRRHTYVVSLETLALGAARPEGHAQRLQEATDWLVAMQRPSGGWGYGSPPEGAPGDDRGTEPVRPAAHLDRLYERTDASNTQFAVLALSAAERAGARVPEEVWRKADRHLRATQLPGGGWGYVFHADDPDEAYGSMTAAAVAGLYLVGDRLGPSDDREASIERGIGWVGREFSLKENPGRGLAWYYFWLYSLERLGMASGRRAFADHDWFHEGAELLVRGQRADGSWTRRLYQDALCLLFLAKGFRPVLVQRLQWGGRWRKDPRDLDHLVRFVGSRVGGRPVAWQTLPPDAPLEEYLAAPILHVSGRGPIRMLTATVARLREYVEQGGVVLFDPGGGDEAFTRSARDLAVDLFPGARLEALPPEHPVYRARHRVGAAGLESLNVGCRAAVLVAPNGLGDGWASAEPGAGSDALRLGENLAVYATGNEPLPDRLHEVHLVRVPTGTDVPRDAFQIGQIQHEGDWRPRPLALPRLLADLASDYGTRVRRLPVPIRLAEGDDASLLESTRRFPVLYLVGHHSFDLAGRERAALKAYLERGGTLVAEACCGRKAFDASFRRLVAEMFPGQEFGRLPADHPIFRGAPGHRIERVAYTPGVRQERPDLDEPVLWGLEWEGHLAIIYSPFGLGPGLDGIRTWGARSPEPADARRLATNIFLYALTH